MILLSSGDWAVWGNFTNRWVYWMFYSGRNGEWVGTRRDFNGNLTQSPSAFGPTTITVWRGASDSSEVRLAHSSASPTQAWTIHVQIATMCLGRIWQQSQRQKDPVVSLTGLGHLTPIWARRLAASQIAMMCRERIRLQNSGRKTQWSPWRV